MPDYFIETRSFAAPFFSDTDTGYVAGDSPQEAMLNAVKSYRHPARLFAADLYANADAFHRGQKPLVRWLSNKARFLQGCTGAIYSPSNDVVRVNGIEHRIEDPCGGSITVEASHA